MSIDDVVLDLVHEAGWIIEEVRAGAPAAILAVVNGREFRVERRCTPWLRALGELLELNGPGATVTVSPSGGGRPVVYRLEARAA